MNQMQPRSLAVGVKVIDDDIADIFPTIVATPSSFI
jgi:hypothetical protein